MVSSQTDEGATRDADSARARDFAQEPSVFDHAPPFQPRRRRLRWWLLALILLAVFAAAIAAALAEFGLPGWLPLQGMASAQPASDLVLDFPKDRQQRQPLPNGTDFFHVSGSIHNVGHLRRSVPTLRIVLRDDRDNIVYSLETAPAKADLAPGESEEVNQAIINAPTAARSAEIGWKAQ